PPIPTLFPYTTLFRSRAGRVPPRYSMLWSAFLTRLLTAAVHQNVDDRRCRPASVSARSRGSGLRAVVTILLGALVVSHLLKDGQDRKSTRLNSSHVKI